MSRAWPVVTLILLAACGGRTPENDGPDPDELEDAAAALIDFLRGAPGAGPVRLADTVALCLAPEGGGGCVRESRERLASPGSWVVRPAVGPGSYRLTPPAGLTRLTTRAGTHINCLDYPLSSRSEALARLPHVGTRLEPEDLESCLQTWNLTVVFDPAVRPPVVVAVVYDQWEW